MEIFSRIRSFFYSVLNRNRIERETRDELRFHLEAHAARLVTQRGLSPEEALREARIEFGSLDKCEETIREARGFRMLDALRTDVRFAVRIFRHNPVFTTVAIVVLALGIGANTAIFSFIDAVVFRSMPVYEPDRLMSSPQAWSLTDCEDVKRDGQIFSGLAAYFGLGMEARDDNYDLLSGRGVSADFFQVLGSKMALGRGFLPGEDRIGSQPVAVISYRYWRQVFQRDSAVVGKSIQLNKARITVVGVAPENFRGMTVTGPYEDIFVPLPVFLTIMHIPLNGLQVTEGQIRSLESRDLRALTMIGRLKEGVSQEQASARMRVLSENLRKAYPSTNTNWQPMLVPANGIRDPGKNRFSFAVLAAAGICLLLITCTNIANLLLARGSARQREIATRFALGATRARVIRQLLSEGFVLSGAAVLVSLAVCHLILKILPELEGTLGAPLVLDLTVDRRVLLFAICIGVITNLLFGLAPAFVSSRSKISKLTRALEPGCSDRVRSRLRRALVMAQTAISVILLISAGLFVRTILYFQDNDVVYNRDSLVLTSDFLSLGRSPGLDFYVQSLRLVRGLPGVRSAGWAAYPPLEQALAPEQIRKDQQKAGDRDWLRIDFNSVSPGYFSSVGIPVLQGRDFTERDDKSAPAVVIVNESLARQFWPGETPLGKRIQTRNRRPGAAPGTCEVVGVVKDVNYRFLNEAPLPYVYHAYGQSGPNFYMHLHVNASTNPKTLVDAIRKACESVNSNVGIGDPRLISEQLDRFLFQERSAALVLGVLGPFSLVLAAVGLYGVVSYTVSRRMAEFGIRLALGAREFDIARMVVMEGMISTLAGLGIGIPASIALSRLIASRLHGAVSSVDPITYVLVSAICLIVAILAAGLPALRARAYPFALLRSE